MKKSISKVLLAAVTTAVMLSSCSKTPDESRYIPKTAGVVVDLNAKQLTTKLVTNGITMDKLFEAAQTKDTANEMMKAWKDAENSGLDLQSHFFASFVFQGQPAENKSYISLTASLKDADKFEAYLKKNIANFSLKTQNDFKYIWEEKQHAVIGWNKSAVIYISAVNPNNLEKYAPGGSSAPDYPSDEPMVDSAVAIPAAQVATEDDAVIKNWVAEVDHLFHLKKEESVGTIEPFAKLLKENADAGIFVNPEAIYNSGQFTMIPANVKKLMEGSFYTGTVNFENGKIVFNGHSYMGKELAAIYKKYGKKEIDMDMLKKYPSQNITGFISYAFDFRMIGDIVKATGMDGMVNLMMGKSGLSMDDVLNAFEGQLTYVASDFAITKKESPYFPGEFTEKPDAKWIFSLKVGNKDAFNKVMTSPMLKEVFTREGDHYTVANPMAAATMPAMSITEKYVTLGSDSALLQEYLGGKAHIKLPDGIESKVKGSMIGGYVDLEKVTSVIPEDKVDEDEKGVVKKAKDLLKDVTFVSKADGGDVQHGEAVLTFKNKDQNSLVQLINLGTETVKVMQAKKAKEKAYEDSLFAAPVDTTVAPQ
ncbi:DUF4836 family protein [Chitinophaga polysaccharea]|uniref:DUF4836 family protein n=1 Tax=Chitinophaga polysaccharea TaxID=1293035 RepID=UPI00115B82ED|nr:DUF4836 family protein [Chitinophaga polysaccharea]